MRTSSKRVSIVAAIAIGALAPAAAASLWIAPNGEGESGFVVRGGAIVPGPGQRYIIAPSNFKCNLSNLALKPKRVPLSKGAINFTGSAYQDVFRKPSLLGTLTWKGTLTRGTIRFRAPKTLRVTSTPSGPVETVINKPCDTGTLRYTKR